MSDTTQGAAAAELGSRYGDELKAIAARLEHVGGLTELDSMITAAILRGAVGARHVHLVRSAERERLAVEWDLDRSDVDRYLEAADRCGWQRSSARLADAGVAHGTVRKSRLEGVLGRLPRGIAHNCPTSSNTVLLARQRREGPIRNDVAGPWAEVRCSRTLSPEHLGILAMALGLWYAHSLEQGETSVRISCGELAQLCWGGSRRSSRLGGRDCARALELLRDWAQLEELHGVVGEKFKGFEAELGIPGPPTDRISVHLDDGACVDLASYDRGEHGPLARGHGSIDFTPAAWVREQLGEAIGADRRTADFHTRIDPGVYAYLTSGTARRLYPFAQARGVKSELGKKAVYFADPMFQLLGLCGAVVHEKEAIVRHALGQLVDADVAFLGFGESRMPRERRPGRQRWSPMNITLRRVGGARSRLDSRCVGCKAQGRRRGIRTRLTAEEREAIDEVRRRPRPQRRRRRGPDRHGAVDHGEPEQLPLRGPP